MSRLTAAQSRYDTIRFSDEEAKRHGNETLSKALWATEALFSVDDMASTPKDERPHFIENGKYVDRLDTIRSKSYWRQDSLRHEISKRLAVCIVDLETGDTIVEGNLVDADARAASFGVKVGRSTQGIPYAAERPSHAEHAPFQSYFGHELLVAMQVVSRGGVL
jgi:hypothetical protein